MSSKCKCGSNLGTNVDCTHCLVRIGECVYAMRGISDPTTSIPAMLRVAEAARQILKASSDVNDAYISGAKPSGRLGSKIVNLAMDSEMLRHALSALSALPASDERGGA